MTPAEEDRELWRDQILVNIEKMRADMKWENRKFALGLFVAFAVAMSAASAVTAVVINYLSKVH